MHRLSVRVDFTGAYVNIKQHNALVQFQAQTVSLLAHNVLKITCSFN